MATAFQIVPALLAFSLITFLPESPRWLILTGREDAALDVLSSLSDTTPGDDDIRQEFIQIKDAILEMASGGFSMIFKQGEYRYFHRTLLAVLLQIMQQFTGINLFTQYLSLMFRTQTDYSPWVARLLGGCGATELFLASFVAVIGIDRFWGRRSLAMFGATGMCVSLIILTVMEYVDTSASHIVMVVFIFVYLTFFAIGWQGMSWLWAVELTPLATRGPANALSTAANWLANFIVVLVTPIAFNNIGYRTYIIFAVLNAFIVPAIFFLYVSSPSCTFSTPKLTSSSPKQVVGLSRRWTSSSIMPRNLLVHGLAWLVWPRRSHCGTERTEKHRLRTTKASGTSILPRR